MMIRAFLERKAPPSPGEDTLYYRAVLKLPLGQVWPQIVAQNKFRATIWGQTPCDESRIFSLPAPLNPLIVKKDDKILTKKGHF